MLGSTKIGQKKQRGFTVVELVVSITVISMIAVGVMWALTHYLQIITRSGVIADMTADSQNVLRSTVEELRYGAGVRQNNTITDPNGPSGGWNTSNEDFVIIIAVPALDTDREYIIDPDTGQPYNNELVYFKVNTFLYKRVLAHPSATGNSLVTTCPPEDASPTCPADNLLIDTINDMVFTLYDQDDNVTTDPLLARSVNIHLFMRKDTFGDPLTLDYDMRTTLRNTF